MSLLSSKQVSMADISIIQLRTARLISSLMGGPLISSLKNLIRTQLIQNPTCLVVLLETARHGQATLHQDIPLSAIDMTEEFRGKGIGGEVKVGYYTRVVRASSQRLQVAVKFYAADPLPLYQGDVWFEVAMLSIFTHPCIVTSYGAHLEREPDYQSYVVMECGDDFGKWLAAHSPCSPAEILDFCSDILSALSYLHLIPIIHRDLKVANLLIFPPNVRQSRHVVKLCDFGCSREGLRQQQWTKGVGTLNWIPPELFRGKPPPSEKADIYSFALVAWSISTQGQQPYASLGPDLPTQVMSGTRPPFPSSLPSSIKDMIRSAWHSDPTKRPSALSLHETCITLRSKY